MYNINYEIVYIPIGYVRDENYNVQHFISHAYYTYDRAKKAMNKMMAKMRKCVKNNFANHTVDELPTDNGGKYFREDGYTCGEIQLVPFTFHRQSYNCVKTFSVCLSDLLDCYSNYFSVKFITPIENNIDKFIEEVNKLKHDQNHIACRIMNYTDAIIEEDENSVCYSSNFIAEENGGSGTTRFKMKLYQVSLDPKY